MSDKELKEILRSSLEMLRTLCIYARRQHGWIIALAETIEKHDELRSELLHHPLYDQGHLPELQMLDDMSQRVEKLVQRLKVRNQ